MNLFIANCTQLIQDFHYRIPEMDKLFYRKIDVGHQIEIKNLSGPAIESIIQQHSAYGFIQVSEIDRTKPFIGLCYQSEKQINMDKVQSAFEHNNEVLHERGREARLEAAISIGQEMEKNALQNSDSATIKAVQVDIEERSADPTVNEKLRYSLTEEPTKSPKRKG